MNEIIKIKCPYCSATLSVKNVPNIGRFSVTCPVCKRKSPFSDYKQLSGSNNDSGTIIGGGGTSSIGRLCDLRSGMTYQLRPGRNVVGRMADSSKASIQVPTGDNKRVSREHIVINVIDVGGKGFVHTVSLFKDRVNATTVDGLPLRLGEELPLHHGSQIELPDLILRFETGGNVDPDGTVFHNQM